jgi:Secretion system C-terminal sorting domain
VIWHLLSDSCEINIGLMLKCLTLQAAILTKTYLKIFHLPHHHSSTFMYFLTLVPTRTILSIGILLNILFQLSAQDMPGFNQVYVRPEFKSEVFMDGCLVGDTLYVLGIGTSPANKLGVTLTEMDTNGNVLNTYSYFDSLGRNFGLGRGYNLKLLPNGELCFLAGNFTDLILHLFRFNRVTHSFVMYEFSFEVVNDIGPRDFELFKDGLIVLCRTVDTMNNRGFIVARLDLSGNILWERRYEEIYPDINFSSHTITVINDDKLLIGAAAYKDSFIYTFWGNSIILRTDSVGTIEWYWESQDSVSASVSDIKQLSNGDYIYTRRKVKLVNNIQISAVINVERIDTFGQILWSQPISPIAWERNVSWNLEPSPDGHWLVTELVRLGQNMEGEGGTAGACVTKITEWGEILWQNCDSARVNTPPEPNECWDEPSGLVVLPSGSSILVGFSELLSPGPPWRQFGWLWKNDANGCWEAPCTSSSTTTTEPQLLPVIYPNPSTGWLAVHFSGQVVSGRLWVTDIQGRSITSRDIQDQEELVFDASQWPAGLYFLHYLDDSGRTWQGKCQVVR